VGSPKRSLSVNDAQSYDLSVVHSFVRRPLPHKKPATASDHDYHLYYGLPLLQEDIRHDLGAPHWTVLLYCLLFFNGAKAILKESFAFSAGLDVVGRVAPPAPVLLGCGQAWPEKSLGGRK
jgi:hypothetical protein